MNKFLSLRVNLVGVSSACDEHWYELIVAGNSCLGHELVVSTTCFGYELVLVIYHLLGSFSERDLEPRTSVSGVNATMSRPLQVVVRSLCLVSR